MGEPVQLNAVPNAEDMYDGMEGLADFLDQTGLDITKLVGMILRAASQARAHKSLCNKFAQRLGLILHTLEPLKLSELQQYHEMRVLLERIEDVLRRGYHLIMVCQGHSCLPLFFTAGITQRRFSRLQDEIDSYLALVPLVGLATIARKEIAVNLNAASTLSPCHWCGRNANGGGGNGSSPSTPHPTPCGGYYGGSSGATTPGSYRSAATTLSPCLWRNATLADGGGGDGSSLSTPYPAPCCGCSGTTTPGSYSNAAGHQPPQPLFPTHMLLNDEKPNACSIL